MNYSGHLPIALLYKFGESDLSQKEGRINRIEDSKTVYYRYLLLLQVLKMLTKVKKKKSSCLKHLSSVCFLYIVGYPYSKSTVEFSRFDFLMELMTLSIDRLSCSSDTVTEYTWVLSYVAQKREL